ncbi:grasp-with-spasm system ATP-grasp peptide maturase [Flavobacterium humi]|uniref:grasp-with-spasm system ATP-grasp peptide maturase n=1 Tax=Flavobacterium humi TaxID=2562683 RepID=UPI00146BBE2A|nr:grasp-with-spasm system ATP-grasp peptide maturase [Flavobacterium humi]
MSDERDLSTTQVIEWLEFLNRKWIRINQEDKVKIEFCGKEIIFKLNNIVFNFSDVTSFWYRRGYINLQNDTTGIRPFDEFQNEELKIIMQFIYYKLDDKHHLNSIKNANVNKLIVTSMARDCNINTPEDYIFSNKEGLEQVINSKNTYITKSISGDSIREFEDFIAFNYTSEFTNDWLIPDSFSPSLVQNQIIKKYELRIFYLAGEFYTMAIFSQKDNQTSVDFRNYNNHKPNRRVPYKLPLEIEEKLDVLMKKMDLNSGSIDMIVTPENEYVFLEINPVGQFGMTSFPCNYNIEKRIADYLSYEN